MLDVRSRLLCAADRILSRDGIQALTQTRIVEAAGVRQSHLTYYFSTCSLLLRAVFEAAAKCMIDEIVVNRRAILIRWGCGQNLGRV